MWDLIVSVPDHCLSFYLEVPQSHATSNENMITNKCEPQQKCRLGTVSKNYGGLNWFYRYPTSPSASVMAQNIQLFGPFGFLTHQWIIT